MSADAERNYKSGPSILRSYLPYSAVVWIQRLAFFGLPTLLVGVPLLGTLPRLYSWSVRRRIYRWTPTCSRSPCHAYHLLLLLFARLRVC